MTTAPQTLPLH